MFLTPEHRRSSRRMCNKKISSTARQEPKQNEVYDDDCPYEAGYEYDREYYKASSKYSAFVDDEIMALRKAKATAATTVVIITKNT
jgi:hypothetical protein